MMKSWIKPCLLAVSVAIICVITQVPALAAAPVIEPIGRIGGIPAPTRVDVDQAGNIYIADAQGGELYKFDMYGRQLFRVKHPGVTGGGLAVSSDGSTIYLSAKTKVYRLDGNGAIMGVIGSGDGEFMAATFLELDDAGFLYVADGGSRFVKVYDADGVYRYSFGYDGPSAKIPFNSITSLALDAVRKFVLVSDSIYPQKVTVHDYAGVRKYDNAVSRFGAPSPIYFGNIGFDDKGRGYLLALLRGNLRTFDLSGAGVATLLSMYNVKGHQDGGLVRPSDVAYDALTKRLFVSCEGSRVEVFGIDGGQSPVVQNEPPGVPVPVSPVGGIDVDSVDVVFTIVSAGDPDGDPLTYDLEISGGGAFHAVTTSSLTALVPLSENVSYVWRVRACDGLGCSEWSAEESFVVNAFNEAPTAPVLAVADLGDVDGKVSLSWSESVDSDPGDQVAYKVEISTSADFSSVVVSESAATTSLQLGQLDSYALLEDGVSYFWRVVAADMAGLSASSNVGQFRYQTSRISVTSQVPRAQVYLGGRPGYAGVYIGDTPLELRDLEVSVARIAVVKPGFEPYYAQALLADGGDLVVAAQLEPAYVPGEFKSSPLTAGGEKISMAVDAAVTVADMNFDGVQDLILSDATGAVLMAAGALGDEGLVFGSSVFLANTGLAGSVVSVDDRNSDGLLDLVVGTAGGQVYAVMNEGTVFVPVFGEKRSVEAGAVPVAVDVAAVPAFGDLDGDGTPDLVVGTGSGKLYRYAVAADGLGAGVQVMNLAGALAPSFADFDADGMQELVVAASEQIYVYRPQKTALEYVGALAQDGALEKSGSTFSGKGAYNVGSGLKLAVLDVDGKSGKDIVLGNRSGDVLLVRSFSKVISPAIDQSLVEMAESIRAEYGADPAGYADLESMLLAGDYAGSLQAAQRLGGSFAPLVLILEKL